MYDEFLGVSSSRQKIQVRGTEYKDRENEPSRGYSKVKRFPACANVRYEKISLYAVKEETPDVNRDAGEGEEGKVVRFHRHKERSR